MPNVERTANLLSICAVRCCRLNPQDRTHCIWIVRGYCIIVWMLRSHVPVVAFLVMSCTGCLLCGKLYVRCPSHFSASQARVPYVSDHQAKRLKGSPVRYRNTKSCCGIYTRYPIPYSIRQRHTQTSLTSRAPIPCTCSKLLSKIPTPWHLECQIDATPKGAK